MNWEVTYYPEYWDGKKLAYLAMERPGYESDRFGIVIREWPEGGIRKIAGGWDRSASSICWSEDSKTIYTTAGNLGQKSLYSIDVASEKVKLIVRDGRNASVSAAGGRVYFAKSTLKSPVESPRR